MIIKLLMLISLFWLGVQIDLIAQPPPPPVYANPSVGSAPLEVAFQFNIADVEKYSWNFGNDKTSNEKAPRTIYTDPGKYDLQIFLQYKDNTLDTLNLTDYIVVLEKTDTLLQRQDSLYVVKE